MRKILTIFLSACLFIPLYAQDEWPDSGRLNFSRRKFEFGVGAGMAFSNDLFGRSDIFKDHIVINMNELEDRISEDGVNVRTSVFGDFFFNLKGFNIAGGKWDFGFFSGIDGHLKGNAPKNIFSLIARGNNEQRVAEGTFNASGAIFAETGFGISARYGKLRLGVKNGIYSPLLLIPKSGLDYRLDTDEGVYLVTGGEIVVYSPFAENGELKYGFDLSFDGTYGLFSFLDIGGSVSNIPVFTPHLNNRMRLIMEDTNISISGQDLLNGNGIEIPDGDITEVYDIARIKVYRPLRLDAFARLKPFKSEVFVLTPNAGITVDMNEDEQYLNVGLMAKLNLAYLFMPYVSTGREEGIWKHRAGFGLNFRVFQLDLEASIQSHNLYDSLEMKGFGIGFGIIFGW